MPLGGHHVVSLIDACYRTMYEHLLLKPEPERFSNQMVSDGMQLVGEPITEFCRRDFGHAMARFGMIFVALGERFRGLEVGGGILLGPF